MIDISEIKDKEIIHAKDGTIQNVVCEAINTVFMWDRDQKAPMYLLDCDFKQDFSTEFETTLFRRFGGKIIVKNTVQGTIIMDKFTADHCSHETENVESINVISDLAMERLFCQHIRSSP